jgi:hypothetical protein
MSYVHAGVCNDVLEVCGEIHTPNYCDACEELHMECIPDSPALRCGDCLSGFVRVGGSCVPTGACDEDTCGPNGLCTGPNGYCLCEPGFAYQDSTPCVDAFVTNSWVDIIPPGGTGMFWQGSDLWDHTSPCHPVEINEAYGMLQYEVTREEYKRCVKAGACPLTACSITGPEDSDPQSSSASCARSSSR